ncbi:hypothetical protein BACCAP_03239 [Pseudoflavonifractor capillosus ATCC 29799]|uniref:Uncharacterized protein n=1 Tax=Pseudoflavonifractor capillosus ATCC 29799 TaxID=411467 RepID=A6NYD8_9FIRM|nr:hypothetical protein BACCAP_03239 [Pseudoflavonifractor capillosus ATCC 29799]
MVSSCFLLLSWIYGCSTAFTESCGLGAIKSPPGVVG